MMCTSIGKFLSASGYNADRLSDDLELGDGLYANLRKPGALAAENPKAMIRCAYWRVFSLSVGR